ncbi:hypothetical protein ACFVHW_35105 [Streptomyces sp. NPDC127110]|uniref:hypothetical protein n=1 Tax=Streptomyces sp. NPDC127110 TaxID=3345362 RepID=UPI003644BDF2
MEPAEPAGEPTLTEPDAAAVAEVMQGLASPARIRILARLLHAPCSVGDRARAPGRRAAPLPHPPRAL